MKSRTEHVEQRDGIRLRTVEEQRIRYPAKPILRERSPLSVEGDPTRLLYRLDPAHERAARRLLREGARRWRRWETICRHAGDDFSPFEAERELLDLLVAQAGLHVEDRHRNGRWRPHRLRVDESLWPWLGVLDPAQLRVELRQELTREELLEVLEAGPPRGMDYGSFAFCLRAAERLCSFLEHGLRPSAKELAGLVDHTKAWTDQRRALVARLLGRSFDDLVATNDRLIELAGPIAHDEPMLWVSQLDSVRLRLTTEPVGIICVENHDTFKHLLPLARHNHIVLWVPGGPPPAEVDLLRRLIDLAPNVPVHACFDLDPAGIRIARLLEGGAGATLRPTGMTPELFAGARRKLELTSWDRRELERLEGRANALEPLRTAIVSAERKVEQEVIQRRLYALFDRQAPSAAAPD